MPLKQLENLFQDSRVYKYRKGQIVLHAGTRLTHIYFLKKGYTKMYSITDQGDEKIILIFPPNSAFPIFPGILQNSNYMVRCFYQAMTDVEFYQLPHEKFMHVLESDAEASKLVLDYVTSMTSDLIRRIGIIENKDARSKITDLLTYLIKVSGKEVRPNVYRINLKITHQDIASLAGLTRETASLQVKKLKDSGVIIHTRGEPLIIDKSKLPD